MALVAVATLYIETADTIAFFALFSQCSVGWALKISIARLTAKVATVAVHVVTL